jgi:L-fucose mutarotase
VQAKGVGAAQMVDAILKLVPLDVEYEKHPIQYMVPDKDSGIVLESSPVWDGVKEAVEANGYDVKCVGEIERTKFYEKAGKAYITVCTSETKPYGCIILQKGVL